MKKTAMTLLVATGLMLSSMGIQPEAAHADAFGHTVCAIFTLGITDCEPFSGQDVSGPLTYSLQNVAVTATSDKHAYAFDSVPNDGTAAQHYTGTYTVSSKIAHEDYGKAHWDFDCPFDPWTYGTTLACTPPAALAGSSLAEPAGAQALDQIDGGYATMTAALQKALQNAPRGSSIVGKTVPSQDALAALSVTKPDLEAVKVDGPTTVSDGVNAVYTATIRNNGGGAGGNVEVVVGMSGALQAWDPIQQSIGLSCTQGTGQNVSTFTCEGGTLAAGQAATLTFRAHAANPGQGTIVVSLNSSRALDESDYSNNLSIDTVTVTT